MNPKLKPIYYSSWKNSINEFLESNQFYLNILIEINMSNDFTCAKHDNKVK